MGTLLAIQYPSWLKPEIIPGLPVRWYGLMYIVAFAVAYIFYRLQIKKRNFPMDDDTLSTMFFHVILGLLLGARVFHSVFYETSSLIYPWQILWPFRNGQFTGFQGMSYHGGVIGGIAGMLIFCKRKNYDFREIGDMFAASIPLGYTFGRIGNFTNAELVGRITSSPLGMIFPEGGQGTIYPSDRNYGIILEEASKMGIDTSLGLDGVLNLPRHASQLYEALFEGIVLWAIIWLLRNRMPIKGLLISIYISGYGLIRFFIEYFREPDAALGYRIQFVEPTLPPALSHPLLCFTTGQILCFAMIILGLVWAFAVSRMPEREAIHVFPSKPGTGPLSAEEKALLESKKAAKRKQRRKTRNKLK